MFNIKHNECIGFESRWRVTRVSSQASSQTTEYTQSDAGTSVSPAREQEIQTEPTPPSSSSNDAEDEMKRLASCLRDIFPTVRRELNENSHSKAFRGYQSRRERDAVACQLLQSLNLQDGEVRDTAVSVSAMGWNGPGNVLAVACSRSHKSGWCHHSENVWLYNLNRDGKLEQEPFKTFATESCVTVLSFNEKHDRMLSVGTHSGSILIWDDELLSSTDAHEERLTEMAWVTNTEKGSSQLLATASTDGFLILWTLTQNLLSVKTKYRIKPPLLGKLEETDGRIYRGITCFSFSRFSEEIFVVGAEGGLVIQCSTLGASKLKGSTEQSPVLDPSCTYHEPHSNQVQAVSFSPNRKEMFLTLGSDGEVRIYLLGQEEPARLIRAKGSLGGALWVPYEEKLVVGCINGAPEVFDVITGEPIELPTVKTDAVEVIMEMVINRVRPNLVATGSSNGTIQIWSILWGAIRASIK